MRRVRKIGFLVVMVVVQRALAMPGDFTKPLIIRSSEAYFDQKTSQIEYVGDIFVKQGSMEIKAQSLKVIMDMKTHKCSKLVATGHPAKFSQQDRNGNMVTSQGDTMSYEVSDATLEILGHGYLNRLQDKITAERILYHVDTFTFTATGKENDRVSMTVHTKNNQTKKKLN